MPATVMVADEVDGAHAAPFHCNTAPVVMALWPPIG